MANRIVAGLGRSECGESRLRLNTRWNTAGEMNGECVADANARDLAYDALPVLMLDGHFVRSLEDNTYYGELIGTGVEACI